MKLYNYFRSSASFRVRIALELKGLPYDYVPVHLVKGEQHAAGYVGRVGAALVPALELADGQLLAQSMAIIEYLDETHPEPRLLPGDVLARAHVRALAQLVACEIHPLNNLRVLKYLKRELRLEDAARDGWYRHWVREGLEAFERQLLLLDHERIAAGLAPSRLCWGDEPTLADCCLVPQIFNAQRLHTDLSGLPRTMAAFDACMQLPAFQSAQPSACPDYEA
ncbi:MAG: maleylacetoacetate isomerase [Proteobacteria bacterium]|nr:maleylacetoacetate isomerase [Pseudomonadota bacterium]MBS0495580.1 maleylacetoacetate isomerase [Pseudomonadota bacterium]